MYLAFVIEKTVEIDIPHPSHAWEWDSNVNVSFYEGNHNEGELLEEWFEIDKLDRTDRFVEFWRETERSWIDAFKVPDQIFNY